MLKVADHYPRMNIQPSRQAMNLGLREERPDPQDEMVQITFLNREVSGELIPALFKCRLFLGRSRVFTH